MSTPSETAAAAGSKEDPSNRTVDDSEDGAWGAETDFDNLEKEASKIFALWELDGAPASGPDATAAAAPAPAVEPAAEQETWAPADTEVQPNAVLAVGAPVASVVVSPGEEAASTLRDVAVPAAVAAPAPAAAAQPQPAAQQPAAQAAPIAFTAPAATVALPDHPVAAPTRPSAAAAVVAAPRAAAASRPMPAMEEVPRLPTQTNYGLIIGAAVALIALAGGSVGYFVVRSGGEAPRAAAPVVAAPPTAPLVAVAPAEPVAPVAPPVVAPVVAPAVVAPVAPAVVAPPEAVLPIVPVAPVVVAPVVAPEPPPPPVVETHRLQVRVAPADSTLSLDGVQVVNPLDRNIPEGTHQLTATHEGFEPATQSVDLSRSREVTMRLRAIPPPEPPPVARTAPSHTPRPPRTAHTTPRTTTPRTTTPRTTTPRTSGHTLVTESPY